MPTWLCLHLNIGASRWLLLTNKRWVKSGCRLKSQIFECSPSYYPIGLLSWPPVTLQKGWLQARVLGQSNVEKYFPANLQRMQPMSNKAFVLSTQYLALQWAILFHQIWNPKPSLIKHLFVKSRNTLIVSGDFSCDPMTGDEVGVG